MQRFRIIKIKHSFGEVGAVIRSQVEMRHIRRRVIFADQSIILFGSCFNFETIDGAVIGRPDQLIPIATGSRAILSVGHDIFKILAPVTVAQKRRHLRVGK